jgi:SMODS-associating 2TM, beta-strand rich effector domain
MHHYSTPESRVRVYGAIAVPAVISAWLIYWATSGLSWPEWLISAPSVVGTYALFYSLFDRYAWNWRLSRQLGLSGVPNVSGIYEGELVSSWIDASGSKVRRPVRFEIAQTWSRIHIYMKVTTGSSSSQSQSAVASVGANPNAARTRYIYINKVNPGLADEDMADHDGAAEILIRPSGELTGTYFNGRPRKGSIVAKRVDAPPGN